MEVRFVETKNGTVEVHGRPRGAEKWNKNRQPLRVVKAEGHWLDRLHAWAKHQGHVVVGQFATEKGSTK